MVMKPRSSVGRASASGAGGQRFESSRGNHHMTADELKKVGKALYGLGWQTRLAEALGVDGSTVRRWVSGAVVIPKPIVAAIRCFEDRAART